MSGNKNKAGWAPALAPGRPVQLRCESRMGPYTAGFARGGPGVTASGPSPPLHAQGWLALCAGSRKHGRRGARR